MVKLWKLGEFVDPHPLLIAAVERLIRDHTFDEITKMFRAAKALVASQIRNEGMTLEQAAVFAGMSPNGLRDLEGAKMPKFAPPTGARLVLIILRESRDPISYSTLAEEYDKRTAGLNDRGFLEALTLVLRLAYVEEKPRGFFQLLTHDGDIPVAPSALDTYMDSISETFLRALRQAYKEFGKQPKSYLLNRGTGLIHAAPGKFEASLAALWQLLTDTTDSYEAKLSEDNEPKAHIELLITAVRVDEHKQ